MSIWKALKIFFSKNPTFIQNAQVLYVFEKFYCLFAFYGKLLSFGDEKSNSSKWQVNITKTHALVDEMISVHLNMGGK